MTEAIKQWIADESGKIAYTPGFLGSGKINQDRQIGAIAGLTKGIEIAEGFAEWASIWYTWCGEDRWDGDNDETFATSQLLEKYLNQLEK